MKRLLLDHGVARDAAVILRRHGWDVVHVAELGMAAAEDKDILAWAAANDRVCVTLDADFHAVLAIHGLSKPSVIRIRQEGIGAERMAQILIDIWISLEETIDRGALVTVTARNVRIRPLPIR